MLYPAHVGALRIIETEHPGSLTHICGTSGGAIVAAARASGYEPRLASKSRSLRWTDRNVQGDLTKLILDTLPGPNCLIDYSWFPLYRYGLIKGDRILKAFREHLAPTFEAAYEATGIKLSVVTTDLTLRTFKVWSYDETPKADLPLAVRASMSIPGLFRYVKINGHVHVDGGVLANFPLDMYGTGKDVVGVRVYRGKESLTPDDPLEPNPIFNFKDYAQTIIDAMMQTMMREHVGDAIHARLIRIKAPMDAMDFKMGVVPASKLIGWGFTEAESFFAQEG